MKAWISNVARQTQGTLSPEPPGVLRIGTLTQGGRSCFCSGCWQRDAGAGGVRWAGKSRGQFPAPCVRGLKRRSGRSPALPYPPLSRRYCSRWGSGCHLQQFEPLALQCGGLVKLGHIDGDGTAQSAVWAKKVVVGHEQRGQGDGALAVLEAGSGA